MLLLLTDSKTYLLVCYTLNNIQCNNGYPPLSSQQNDIQQIHRLTVNYMKFKICVLRISLKF